MLRVLNDQILLSILVHDDLFLINGPIVYVRFDSIITLCNEYPHQGQWFGWCACLCVCCFCLVLLCIAVHVGAQSKVLSLSRVFSHKVYCSGHTAV